MASPLVLNAITDGYANTSTGGSSWHSAVTTGAVNDANMAAINLIRATSHSDSNEWTQCVRAFYAFDTSALPDTCTIDSATLVLKGHDKKDDLSDGLWELAVFDATLYNEYLVGWNDFVNAGTIQLTNSIAYDSWNTSGNNTLTFNATGLAYFNKSGNTVFCIRDATHDVADELDPNNHDPNWISFKASYVRWVAGAEADKPILTINYTEAPSVLGAGSYFAKRIAIHGGL